MKIEKVKKFCRKHKTAIAFFTGMGVVCVGSIIGVAVDKSNKKRFYTKNGHNVLSVLDDYLSKARGDSKVFGGTNVGPLKPADLGEMGKAMLELGCPEDQTFTHFIAIGESIE